MPEKEPRIEKIHCNSCLQSTKHRRLHEHRRSASNPEDDGIWWSVDYELFVCQGCDEVTLRQEETSSEDDPSVPTLSYFPPRVARRMPTWLWNVEDENILALLKEVYAALQGNSRRLAMMGCRAILDRIMVKAVGDAGSFPKALDQMVNKQLLAKPDRDVLYAAIDAGSASAHRGYLPTPEVMEHVVTIVEHAVQATLLQDVAKEIKRKTPRRSRRR